MLYPGRYPGKEGREAARRPNRLRLRPTFSEWSRCDRPGKTGMNRRFVLESRKKTLCQSRTASVSRSHITGVR